MERAVAQPVVLRHALHQDAFGGCGGVVFGSEILQEVLVLHLAFGVQDAEGAEGESVLPAFCDEAVLPVSVLGPGDLPNE
jgi:hypothetical protein